MIDPGTVFTSLTASRASSRLWTVPEDLPYFRGHFPGNPIFPAVGIVDASVCVVGAILDKSVTIEAIASAKFTHPISPGLRVQVEVTAAPDQMWNVEWRSEDGATSYASLKMRVNA